MTQRTLRPPRDQVVLLEPDGRVRGWEDRAAVHTSDTPLHLAFSTYLFDAEGRVLITRRALGKRTWPGVWSNSCCGHPQPGEDLTVAARRRILEELGLTVAELHPIVPDFRYRATDASGIVENEICPVFWGRVDAAELAPDPAEVAEHAWVAWEDLLTAVTATPQVFSPWTVLQVPRVDAAGLAAIPARRAGTLAAFMADVDTLLFEEIAALDARWAGFNADEGVEVLPDDLPAWLSRLLLGRGKRLRASMVYWGHVAVGAGRPDAYANVARLAAALETLHLFALIHDDVMDRSESRRGRPSAHVEATAWHESGNARGDGRLFGQNLAILLGDLAHTLADHLVDPLPPEQRRLWHDLCVELIAGQRADLTGAAAGRRDRRHAEHIARLKSGRYTIERPLQLGALATNTDADARATLDAWGEHIGRAFALRDDYLGVWGDPRRTGKPAGDDLAEGKATTILALASERFTGDAADALGRLGTRHLRPDDVALVTHALTASGVRDEIEAMIAREVEHADACLDASHFTTAGVEGLKAAARSIAWRDS